MKDIMAGLKDEYGMTKEHITMMLYHLLGDTYVIDFQNNHTALAKGKKHKDEVKIIVGNSLLYIKTKKECPLLSPKSSWNSALYELTGTSCSAVPFVTALGKKTRTVKFSNGVFVTEDNKDGYTYIVRGIDTKTMRKDAKRYAK